MGYQTTYRLEYEFIGHQDRFEKLMLEDAKENPAEEWEWEIESIFEDDSDRCFIGKWYQHDEQMRKFSAKYPMVVFTLHGEGEESGDIWKKYYCAGKCQVAYAKITYDEFNPDKLE